MGFLPKQELVPESVPWCRCLSRGSCLSGFAEVPGDVAPSGKDGPRGRTAVCLARFPSAPAWPDRAQYFNSRLKCASEIYTRPRLRPRCEAWGRRGAAAPSLGGRNVASPKWQRFLWPRAPCEALLASRPAGAWLGPPCKRKMLLFSFKAPIPSLGALGDF